MNQNHEIDQETVDMVSSQLEEKFEAFADKCDECGEILKHHYDRNGVDDGTSEGKTLCYDCFEDLCAEDEEE